MQQDGRHRVMDPESADSDAAGVVLGIVIEIGLSASGQGTGRSSELALTANGIQASPVLMRTLPPFLL